MRRLNHYGGDVVNWMVNIAPIEPHSLFRINKRSWIEPNSPNNVKEHDDAQHERELNEVMDAIHAIWEFDLELDNNDDDRHIEDVSMAKEIPSQANEPNILADHFTKLKLGFT